MAQYGPEAALIVESFSPRLRYSGTLSLLSMVRLNKAIGDDADPSDPEALGEPVDHRHEASDVSGVPSSRPSFEFARPSALRRWASATVSV